jgi:DNA-directed RNA polymerase specialized sigma24 family protein
LRDAVLSLNTIHRDVVLLRFVEELSGSEIAEVLGIDEDAVWSRLNAALRQLRPKVAARDEGSG